MGTRQRGRRANRAIASATFRPTSPALGRSRRLERRTKTPRDKSGVRSDRFGIHTRQLRSSSRRRYRTCVFVCTNEFTSVGFVWNRDEGPIVARVIESRESFLLRERKRKRSRNNAMATAAESPVPNESTEIRCQEKSKGGLCYEVILAEPTVPKRAPSPPQQSPTQQTAIEDKLKAAEERRLSIEANKLAALTAKLSKIEEASRKKDELSAAFITATRESLDAKMNNTEEKREAHIAELKNKLKEHLESVEKTRLSLEQQTEEVRCAVEEKLKTAAAQRDENIKRMLDRLKEHEEQVARVRQGMSERVQQLESQIQGKLEQARERRETIEREQKEKLRNHNTVKIAKMRQMAARELLMKKCEFDKKVSTAEMNRQREIQRRVQAIRRHHERRAEIVRQNKKERYLQPEAPHSILPVENETASSG
ncbi:vicilin-like seed storage protein At2g18540 isoform X1 [Solenopsis invicta]|uniref:vicilin-like seed storage protein At2g18540 isoform X1 n=2 Tax=Solenopsis invicta TaxID=13686 RepID=UPI00193CC0C6|nr:vicilin-like seed storage protein At2g18540 isoform X1 [Solenopsis invicta]